jgi:hypothetical protein
MDQLRSGVDNSTELPIYSTNKQLDSSSVDNNNKNSSTSKLTTNSSSSASGTNTNTKDDTNNSTLNHQISTSNNENINPSSMPVKMDINQLLQQIMSITNQSLKEAEER